MSDFFSKILGKPIGNVTGNKVPKDGDGDGMFSGPDGEDNIPMPLAVEMIVDLVRSKPASYLVGRDQRNAARILSTAQTGGFTKNRDTLDDIKNGVAVARNKHGLPPMPVEEVYFPDGTPRPEAVALVLAWLDYHGRQVFDNPSAGAREVAIGGWIEDGKFYLDVTDVYESTPENIARAVDLGRAQNQKSVAILEKVQIAAETDKPEDWAAAFLPSGGTGGDTINPEMLKDLREAYMSVWKSQQKAQKAQHSGKSVIGILTPDENVRIIVVD